MDIVVRTSGCGTAEQHLEHMSRVGEALLSPDEIPFVGKKIETGNIHTTLHRVMEGACEPEEGDDYSDTETDANTKHT